MRLAVLDPVMAFSPLKAPSTGLFVDALIRTDVQLEL
jgi:hypothetical protein